MQHRHTREPRNSGARWPSSEIDMEDHIGGNLIYYAIVFLIVAIVAAALGFGGVAGTAISGAHLLLMVAVVFIVVGLLAGVLRRGV
jgi:uncharacterized membrane protein YtjA (UPF0391 family)